MRLNVNGNILDNIELVILDKDGTITDLYIYWSWIAKERATIICSTLNLDNHHIAKLQEVMGLDLKGKRFKPEGPIGVKKRTEVLAAVVSYLESQSISESRAVCEQAFAETDLHAQKNLGSIVKLIPGFLDFFNRIKGKCKIAIATADNTERASTVMRHLGVADVDLIVGGDQVSKSKPDPQAVTIILEKLHVHPNRAVIIGDSRNDIQCGKNAGLLGEIAVCTGLDSKSDLLQSTQYVVSTLSDITVEAE